MDATDPLSPGRHTLIADGASLTYVVRGSGPVLVVQPPGWGIGAAVYEAGLAPLEERATVVYLHPRGSIGAPAEAPSKLHVAAFVDDLESLRAHLRLDRIALAGHSHGGLIAMHYALRHPDRVRALLLLCPQLVGVPGHPAERDAQVRPEEDAEIAEAHAYLERVGGFGALFDARSDEEITAFLRGIAPLYFRESRHASRLRALLDTAPLPVRTVQAVSGTDGAFPLVEPALRGCGAPTLVLSGRFDVFCPPSTSRQLVGLLPAARRVVFERSGHFPWIEEPDAFFRAAAAFVVDPSMIPAR